MITMQKNGHETDYTEIQHFYFSVSVYFVSVFNNFRIAAQILHFKTAVWYLDMASSCNDVLTQPPD